MQFKTNEIIKKLTEIFEWNMYCNCLNVCVHLKLCSVVINIGNLGLKLISLLVILLEVVPTRKSVRGTILILVYFTSGRTIIYSTSLFRENNNVVVFPIPFPIFMPLANLWLIRLQGQFPILRTRSCPISTR